jgi:hypothetical protein
MRAAIPRVLYARQTLATKMLAPKFIGTSSRGPDKVQYTFLVGRYVKTKTIWTRQDEARAAKKLPCDRVMTGWLRYQQMETRHPRAKAPKMTLAAMMYIVMATVTV